MATEAPATDLERRKRVRVQVRTDLSILPQKYEGRTYYVVKDPVSLRYWRFKDREYFLIQLMDGKNTLDEAQKKFERNYRPDRLPLEELEQFSQQLLSVGLARNDSPHVGKQLFDRRKERHRNELLQLVTNILYIKIPVFDPDKILNWMLPFLNWMFTTWFLLASIAVMLAAVTLVATHFETFQGKLPAYREFFTFKNLAYMWVALGVVKVIHEFGHGLSCKAFGGEVHEMGALFLCLSPCLYCNVSDAWTLPNKWHRIIISAAGIYVELIIATLATFLWWNSSSHPFINNMSLSLMVVCSVSTFVFNANPLMRYDGYYVLADWLEIPNLRDKSNKYIMRLVQEHSLGIEQTPEAYMERWRRVLFVAYAIVSYLYRWIVTYSILIFLYMFLKPYKLGSVSALLMLASLGSMVGWPLFRLVKNLNKRGRLPDMKTQRVSWSTGILAALVLSFFFLPLPVGRVRETALVQVRPDSLKNVHAPLPGGQERAPGKLEHLYVRDGQHVEEEFILADFYNLDLENELEEARTQFVIQEEKRRSAEKQLQESKDERERGQLRAEVAAAQGEKARLAEKIKNFEDMLGKMSLRAPMAGVVMSPPQVEEIGKEWDRERTTPFCTIGDPTKLRVLVPVSPADRDLLNEDLKAARSRNQDLAVDIRIQGLGARTWKGRITELPESEARDIPLALTNRGGGPVAVQPTGQPNVFVPLNQHYLVAVDILDPDGTICPGTLAQVKIHCRWKSCAWWVLQTISSTFDLPLFWR